MKKQSINNKKYIYYEKNTNSIIRLYSFACFADM
jgi:hypothetical protein